MKVEIECCECGKGFERHKHNMSENNYCSKDCLHESQKNREDLTCSGCGKEFERAKSLVNEENNYCTRECREENRERNYIDVECNRCGERFEVTPSRYEENTYFFCCKVCEAEYWSENRSGKDSPHYDRYETECSNCGAELNIIKHDMEKYEHHFCDASCRNESNIFYNRREGHHNWKGDEVENYPGEFQNKRLGIIERDGEECILCEMSRAKHKEEYGKDLYVHHIDGDTLNNEDSNLATLCHVCNAKVEYLDERPSYQKMKNSNFEKIFT